MHLHRAEHASHLLGTRFFITHLGTSGRASRLVAAAWIPPSDRCLEMRGAGCDEHLPRITATFLFADVERHPELWEVDSDAMASRAGRAQGDGGCGGPPKPVSPRDSSTVRLRSSRTTTLRSARSAGDRCAACLRRHGDPDYCIDVTPGGIQRASMRVTVS
jgi:hypothetical protein